LRAYGAVMLVVAEYCSDSNPRTTYIVLAKTAGWGSHPCPKLQAVKQSSKNADQVVLCPRQTEGAAAKLQEQDGAHSGQRALACVQWDSEQSGTKWRCGPGRWRGQRPSSRRRMGPTLVRELWLVSSGTVSRAGPSGAVPQADRGGSGQAPGGGWAHSGQRALACVQWVSEQDQVALCPRQTEGAAAKLQEEDGPTLVREL